MKIFKPITATLCAGAIAISATKCPEKFITPVEPVKDRIVSKASDTIKHKKILILDCFYKNNVKIDKDFVEDVAHGKIVSGIIENGLPNADVYKKNIKYSDLENNDSMVTHITKPLIKELKEGKTYDAINLSISAEMPFTTLSKRFGKEINPENIQENAITLKKFLRENREKLSDTADAAISLVDCMDSISANGTKIYVSAGNGGKDKFNLLALIDNAVNVGSVDNKGYVKKFSEDHSLINRWVHDDLPLTTVKDGYTIDTGDDKIFINKKNCSGLFHIRKKENLDGTSFAAPKAIIHDLW